MVTPGIDEVDVYLIDLDAGGVNAARYEALFSREEQERAAGFRFPADRRRYLCMHGILRTLLSPYLDKTAESIVFHSNEYGKPFVPDGIEFNMSYSAGRGLVGVACLPIGVDIEMVDPGKVTQEMIEEVFSDGERKSFYEHTPTALVRSFFRGWVRKESVVKAMGTGVSFPLRRVESRLDREGYAASIDEVEYYTCSLEECGTGYEAALTIAGACHLPKINLM